MFDIYTSQNPSGMPNPSIQACQFDIQIRVLVISVGHKWWDSSLLCCDYGMLSTHTNRVSVCSSSPLLQICLQTTCGETQQNRKLMKLELLVYTEVWRLIFTHASLPTLCWLEDNVVTVVERLFTFLRGLGFSWHANVAANAWGVGACTTFPTFENSKLIFVFM
jgi:hypothetical protein